MALFRSIIDATAYASDKSNRKEISKAVSPKNFLNQPVTVLEQVLTGTFATGLDSPKIMKVPDRIDFDPFPYHSMAVWILSQMKRWGYIKGDVDYKSVAEEVYLATEAGDVMKGLGMGVPKSTYEKYEIMGKTFDPDDPEGYINSFAIKR